ncbi:related to tRNA splicing endonuclease gamma subunit [Cephalotrichum gorgonifer]|uniref:tRNA-splicing endonuclease subunit Sen34 n=1 Tax=Cephalotrichum gorgonifer TaxID=2041049 RepID=A0AAE8SVF3_9PEZI|nr:related to tRNA splicing endonuclease gamma subunit [Cephalotrichum gorgonifer]
MGAPEQVHISRIAGRYLVFDHQHIAILRRHHGLCGVLTGTVPQSPTQNVFMGAPVELRSEDATILVEAGVAVVRDETQMQLSLVREPGNPVRQRYQESLRLKRHAVERAMRGQLEEKLSASELTRSSVQGTSHNPHPPADDALSHLTQANNGPSPGTSNATIRAPSCSVTPTAVGNIPVTVPCHDASRCSPTYRYLLGKGFFMTPGLRFGAQLSVYPGDPLRYHAHYLANDYKWDEEVPLLDLVGAGRLSTAVKKGFLAGGEDPSTSSHPDPTVRVFCVEWAGM